MFFNLDRSSKQNLFNQYKQDAMDYRQKKNFEKQRRIQEEREYLAKREQQEKEADERIYREKLQRKNAQREEYNSMFKKKIIKFNLIIIILIPNPPLNKIVQTTNLFQFLKEMILHGRGKNYIKKKTT